ncbi:hypothetical protein KH5_19730 [Urechidicola sp. KH5]
MVEVSVIIPNYNHSEFLEQRLNSVFNQSFQDYEVIILDDASTDASIAILNNFKNHPKVSHFIVNKQNSGSPFKQWKKGLELANGKYIWIAESDDYCDADFLKKLLELNAKNNNHLDLIYSQSIDVDENETIIENRLSYTANFLPNIWETDFVISGEDFIKNYLKVKCVIPNASAVLFKKQLVTNEVLASGFLDMRICGDWFFWILISKNATIGFVSEPLNKFRYHKNVTRRQISFEKQYHRCHEEKLIRDYLDKHYQLTQDEEAMVLYEKWFVKNKIANLLKKHFYTVKLKHHSLFNYIIQYFKVHNTWKKFLTKISV